MAGPAVSRETPPEPPEAAVVFAGHLERAREYAELLSDDGIMRGLIGPREVPRLWERHLLGCAIVTDAIPHGATVADVGSGAGLPGVAMAIRRPDLHVTLVEPLLRRTTFLLEVVAHLGLDQVEVRRARAEELHGASTFDVVTSRAVAPLPRLLGWCLPLLADDGHVLAMKGSAVREEIASAGEELGRLGAREPEVLVLGEGQLLVPTTVVRVGRHRSAG